MTDHRSQTDVFAAFVPAVSTEGTGCAGQRIRCPFAAEGRYLGCEGSRIRANENPAVSGTVRGSRPHLGRTAGLITATSTGGLVAVAARGTEDRPAFVLFWRRGH